MNRLVRGILFTLLAFALVSGLVVATLVALLPQAADLAAGGIRIIVDGETVDLAARSGAHLWAVAALAVAGVMVAVFVALAVVPLVLVLALAAAALPIGVVLLCIAVAVAVASSPLLLIGALAWWALRPRRPAAGTAA
jgi:hypothetical protein